MDMYLKTSKYLLNCVQHISCLCQGWLFFLGQQIGLGKGRNLECWEADKQHCPGEEVLAGNAVRVSRCYIPTLEGCGGPVEPEAQPGVHCRV